MNIQRVLVANRGEIAVRIVRSLRQQGIESVLAVSAPDRESLGAQLADRSVCIGPARANESYLQIGTLIEAARGTGAQAIHPGYGFLSERAEFAQACEDNNIIFIGPTAEQIRRVGDKLEARRIAQEAGVPVTPGGAVESLEEALAMAESIGFPVLIKAVGGGGGRGLKKADSAEQLSRLFELASAEAQAAFGDGRVYIERFVTRGRHVEVQVLGDGNRVIHLGDRDCSVQRRYQKLIEEAPAPCLPDTLRSGLHEAALRFAGHIGYRNAGTVEFLVDVERQAFYFLEMNARIQVEHPVTEQVTGIDLIAQQLHIAQGLPLEIDQDDVQIYGHAIECRINADDPDNDFRPSPGVVRAAYFPTGEGLRVDTHIQTGASVPPYYDSMIAKIIATGKTRDEARRRLAEAIRNTRIEGIETNLSLHQLVLNTPEFSKGGVDTRFLGCLLAGATDTAVQAAS
ncbi:MAG TPA: acetyl-CoA carboxylase biotin carboxylase subunit [Pusillimonas sp.]|uniref:acetyl-CoA carboxylase biotin carboxylase subunit n=1 Tax=unclassified Pusillimonas TaxID=2640016 RepID=UPI00262A539C|nr:MULTISPECIES: acetyl-CoA carboxylase biotin carboxylase subunit [unclassified Pusillimonas]HLU19918.1 acetyl-CoA carboxylase biotin carboxylase subunit [Pusillimonas sp.]